MITIIVSVGFCELYIASGSVYKYMETLLEPKWAPCSKIMIASPGTMIRFEMVWCTSEKEP